MFFLKLRTKTFREVGKLPLNEQVRYGVKPIICIKLVKIRSEFKIGRILHSGNKKTQYTTDLEENLTRIVSLYADTYNGKPPLSTVCCRVPRRQSEILQLQHRVRLAITTTPTTRYVYTEIQKLYNSSANKR